MTDRAPVSRGTLVAAIAVLTTHAPTSPALTELQAAYHTLPDQTPHREDRPMNDHTHLRALAEAATPGPWGLTYGPNERTRLWSDADGHTDDVIALDPTTARGTPHPDMTYIAAVSPTTTLALLDELDALRAKVAELEARNRRFANLIANLGNSVNDGLATEIKRQRADAWDEGHRATTELNPYREGADEETR